MHKSTTVLATAAATGTDASADSVSFTDILGTEPSVITIASDGSLSIDLNAYQVTAADIACRAHVTISGESYREWSRKVAENGAAACLVICQSTGKFLLDHRGPDVDYPGTYGLPAGALEDNETPIAGAFRELREETGKVLKKADSVIKLAPRTWLVVVTIEKQFAPRISTESADLVWRSKLPAKSKMHPAMAKYYDMYVDLIKNAVAMSAGSAKVEVTKKSRVLM